jgi:hypothetical protein
VLCRLNYLLTLCPLAMSSDASSVAVVPTPAPMDQSGASSSPPSVAIADSRAPSARADSALPAESLSPVPAPAAAAAADAPAPSSPFSPLQQPAPGPRGPWPQPTWTPDAMAPQCELCKKVRFKDAVGKFMHCVVRARSPHSLVLLSQPYTFFFRRHHCRAWYVA